MAEPRWWVRCRQMHEPEDIGRAVGLSLSWTITFLSAEDSKDHALRRHLLAGMPCGPHASQGFSRDILEGNPEQEAAELFLFQELTG